MTTFPSIVIQAAQPSINPSTDWEVSQVLGDLRFTRSYSEEDAVTAPNDEDSVLAFLAWIESLRDTDTGTAVGTDITAVITTFGGSREYQLVQGGDCCNA